MRATEFQIHGTTDSKGQLMIRNSQEMKNHFSQWPDAEFIMEVRLYQKGTSQALIGYYKRVIVPQFQRAFKEIHGIYKSLEDTSVEITKTCPFMQIEVPKEESFGFHVTRMLHIEEVGNQKASEFIQYLKWYGAENFCIVIQEPKHESYKRA